VDRDGRRIEEMDRRIERTAKMRAQYDASVELENRACESGTLAEYRYRVVACGQAWRRWRAASESEAMFAESVGARTISVERNADGYAVSVREEPYE